MNSMRQSISQIAFALCVGVLLATTSQAHAAPREEARPNIIVVMVDDMGWSDLGCYGGEVQTPHVDSLAKQGLRFTSFYNTSRCCPTRASLLTGLYPHQAGVGQMTFDRGKPAYRGWLQDNCVTIAEVLKASGYRTSMVGKWHLSLTPQGPEHLKNLNNQVLLDRFSDPATYPVARGFEDHYGIIWGVVNFFDPFSLVHNTKAIKSVPEDYYLTDALTDHAVKLVEGYAKDDKPFFMYLAHAAPHWPLHALPEDIDKYKDTYTVGWDAIRRERYKRQVAMGLIDADDTVLSPVTSTMGRNREQSWKDEKHQAWEARCMAVHAAMIDRVDQGMGRLIATLKKTGQFDNTLILFLSDNGASPERPGRGGFDRVTETREGKKVLYYRSSADKQTMPGPETTYAGIGPMWANASNTPYRYWKKEQYEGGVCTPLIAHWPKGIKQKPGAITTSPGHVIDIMATCVDLAGVSYPKQFNGHAITLMEGKSLRPVFEAGKREGEAGHEAIYFEHYGARGMRQGDWKIVSLRGKPWELYNLAVDRTELRDLAAKHPDRVKAMAASWLAWAKRVQADLPGGKSLDSTRPGGKAVKPVIEDGWHRYDLKARTVMDGNRAPRIAKKLLRARVRFQADLKTNGVALSHGGNQHGYSIYLSKGVVHAAIHHGGKRTLLSIDKAVDAGKPLAVELRVQNDGRWQLRVGDRVAETKAAPGPIAAQPLDPLEVGRDSQSTVGDYASPAAFTGKLIDAQVWIKP